MEAIPVLVTSQPFIKRLFNLRSATYLKTKILIKFIKYVLYKFYLRKSSAGFIIN